MKKIVLVAASLLALSACEAMEGSSGPTQTLRIITAPDGANCAIDRDRITIDRPEGTPVNVKVEKTGKPLTIRCIKTGYKQAKVVLKPNKDNSYESPVTMTLAKKK